MDKKFRIVEKYIDAIDSPIYLMSCYVWPVVGHLYFGHNFKYRICMPFCMPIQTLFGDRAYNDSMY